MNTDADQITIDATSSPSESIVMEIAKRDNTSPFEMQPLYEVIDPEALDTLFKNGVEGEVKFEYAGYEVTVTKSASTEIPISEAGGE